MVTGKCDYVRVPWPGGNIDFTAEDKFRIEDDLRKWLLEEKDFLKQRRIYKIYCKYYHELQKGQKVYEGKRDMPLVQKETNDAKCSRLFEM